MKKCIFLYIFSFFCFLSFAENYTDIFWTFSGIGIVKNNTVQFYNYDKDSLSWIPGTFTKLSLPSDCSKAIPITNGDVFRGIGVIKENTVQFFYYDSVAHTWNSDPSSNINLPTGCSDVVSIEVNIGATGFWIVQDNILRFYSYTLSRGWIYNTNYKLALPKGYTDILPITPRWYLSDIAVVNENEVKFYSRENDNDFWHLHRFSNINFKLRAGYTDVFLMIFDQKFVTGVLIENTIHFIYYDKTAWKPGPYTKFTF
jgi:hypothetical protein